ncbi:transposase [Candidatus Rhabdochlamydia oedothoracis]|uniref:transposase n=1 Tax=Candidatus Rhabdochlamydia oedothoracis TaxID=2720720 RepID=UPI001C64D11E|nr:transposase [Candidatus Rhabdochlamydia oedothoracis]
MDQSGISQYVHRQYARSARGKQIFGGISGKRFGRQSVISALQVKKLLAPMCFEGTCNYEMLFLPPYSPDLNPIEKYWANMKTKIRELLPTVANLSEALDQAVLSMSI